MMQKPTSSSKKTAILALDLGMKISWAIRCPDGGVISSSDDIAERYNGGGMQFWLFRLHLAKVIRDALDNGVSVDIVFIEGDSIVHHKWLPHLEEFAKRSGTPVRSAKAGAIKNQSRVTAESPRKPS